MTCTVYHLGTYSWWDVWQHITWTRGHRRPWHCRITCRHSRTCHRVGIIPPERTTRTPPPPRHVFRVGRVAAPCLARHTAVLVAAHVAIRHLTTADCIRSTADTITAAHQAGHVPHVLTSHTAFRPRSNFQLPHVRPL